MDKWKIVIKNVDIVFLVNYASQCSTGRVLRDVHTDNSGKEHTVNCSKTSMKQLRFIIKQNVWRILTLELEWIICRRHLHDFTLRDVIRLSGTSYVAQRLQLNFRKLLGKDTYKNVSSLA